jgi:hypothetical protein
MSASSVPKVFAPVTGEAFTGMGSLTWRCFASGAGLVARQPSKRDDKREVAAEGLECMRLLSGLTLRVAASSSASFVVGIESGTGEEAVGVAMGRLGRFSAPARPFATVPILANQVLDRVKLTS